MSRILSGQGERSPARRGGSASLAVGLPVSAPESSVFSGQSAATGGVRCNSALRLSNCSHRIESWELRLTTKEDIRVALTCPSCGNDQNFLVKTLQMHVVHLEDSRVEVSEEGRPAVLEVQCDECETALNFDEIDEGTRKELLLTLGAR
jgi:RNase P subunit RPR2